MPAHRLCANRRSALSYRLNLVSCLVMLAVCVSCAKQTDKPAGKPPAKPADSSKAAVPAKPAAPDTPAEPTEPAPTEPTAPAEPDETTEPPAPAEPAVTEPAQTVEPPAPAEPAPAEPAPTEPAPAEPAPAEPAPAEPAPAEPAPTEPAPTEPAPTEPAPAEPAPAEPAPTEPAPAEPAAPAEPVMDDAGQTTEAVAAPETERVLRHAVFFKFKDGTSAEDVQKIVDAFRDLPSKIDTIVDLKWGNNTNTSPEKMGDDLTHCFLLTFKDEAGRAVYLPHEAHKAFGEMLGPHLEKAFVVDYWGIPETELLAKELKHAVFIKFKDDAPAEAVEAFEEACVALSSKIDTMKASEWGTNNSPEGLNDGFTHCFMITFDSEEGLAAFGPNPEHTALVEMLTPLLDKARVLDFWVEK